LKPKHNVDKHPYRSSVMRDRYADVLQAYGEELEYFND